MEAISIEPLLDAKDVRRLLHCSLPLVYKLADHGRLPCVKIPCIGSGKPKHTIRFKKADVIDFIERYYHN